MPVFTWKGEKKTGGKKKRSLHSERLCQLIEYGTSIVKSRWRKIKVAKKWSCHETAAIDQDAHTNKLRLSIKLAGCHNNRIIRII